MSRPPLYTWRNDVKKKKWKKSVCPLSCRAKVQQSARTLKRSTAVVRSHIFQGRLFC